MLSTHDRVDQDTLPLSHELLADMLCVQRSTVSTITRKLQTAGLIEQGRGCITVKDRAGLERHPASATAGFARPFERLLPLTYAHNDLGIERPSKVVSSARIDAGCAAPSVVVVLTTAARYRFNSPRRHPSFRKSFLPVRIVRGGWLAARSLKTV